MHILVIGCGYLGERAALAWSAQGHQISALTRSPDRGAGWQTRGWRAVVGDVTQPESLACLQQLPPIDLCLYAVGFDRNSGASRREVYEAGLATALQGIAPRCDRLVYISSSSVYGEDAGGRVTAASPCEPTTESGQVCLAAEDWLSRQAEQRADFCRGGVLILRLTGIYGPGRLLARVDQLQRGEPLGGNPEAWLNLIHVDDAVQCLLRLSTSWPVQQQRVRRELLSDTQPVRRRDFYSGLAKLVGAPAPRFDETVPTRSGSGGLGKCCDSASLLSELGLSLLFPTWETGLVDAVRRSASDQ